ncbi:MAG: hypothetical protein L0196_00315 [candidate division Zixibacteria bacterium]|nr:hypothetical protein [candidate division Zixibacteria bacterium]
MKSLIFAFVTFLSLFLTSALAGKEIKSGYGDSSLILEDVTASPGDSVFDRWKQETFARWKGKPGGRENLEEVISGLLHFYSQNSFPFAEISPTVEEPSPGRVRLGLSIIVGPAVYLSEIRCPGFSAGEQKQLTRMLAFHPGYFDEREIEVFKGRSKQYPELVWSGEPKLAGGPDFSYARLELPLLRRSKNRVEGGLGYLPTGAEKGTFGELSIRLVTLGKIGRETDFRWERPNSGTRLLSFGYQDFFLAPAVFYLSGRLSQEEREERFFRFSADAGISALIAGGWKGSLHFGYGRVTPRERSESSVHDSAAAREYRLGIGIKKGEERLSDYGYLAVEVQAAYKRVFYGANVQSGTPKQVGLEAAKSFPINSAWKLYLRSKGGAKFLPAFLFTRSDLFYLGGYGSLRGYLDESLPATRYFSGRVEPRLHLGAKDYLFGFFDFAHFSVGKNYSGLSVSDQFKPGFGLGLSAGAERLVLAVGWGEKGKVKDGIVYLRLAGEL